MKITAIIPTLNEEVHIEDSIKSVDFADEIIVIDSFSQDSTIEIVKKHNVKIIQRVFHRKGYVLKPRMAWERPPYSPLLLALIPISVVIFY